MGNSVTAMYEMTKSNIEKTIADQKARGVDSSVSEKCLEELEASYMEYEKDNGEMPKDMKCNSCMHVHGNYIDCDNCASENNYQYYVRKFDND